MESILSSDKTNAPFMFIVFIPAWTYCTGWQALSQSPLLTKSILLSQKDNPHYYCEGTQLEQVETYKVLGFQLQSNMKITEHIKTMLTKVACKVWALRTVTVRWQHCGTCTNCKDMKLFGGPSRLKQACMLRICQNLT